MRDRHSAETDILRTRAARYRLLAETLVDLRVIAVVKGCALDLEIEANLTETADSALSAIAAKQGHRQNF